MYLAKSEGLSLHFVSAAEDIPVTEKCCPSGFMCHEIYLTNASHFGYFQAMCCLSRPIRRL